MSVLAVGCVLASLIAIVSVSASCWILAFYSGSINDPDGVLASLEGLAQMVLFLFQLLWVRAYCFSSMVQGSRHTIFG